MTPHQKRQRLAKIRARHTKLGDALTTRVARVDALDAGRHTSPADYGLAVVGAEDGPDDEIEALP